MWAAGSSLVSDSFRGSLGSISWSDQMQNLIHLDSIREWSDENPTTLKVMTITALFFGLGIFPFSFVIKTFSWTPGIAGSLLTLVFFGAQFLIPEKPAPEYKVLYPQERKTPPIGMCDTVVLAYGEAPLKSVHGEGTLFKDEEILERLEIIQETPIALKINALYTKHGKAIIQQQAVRGCTAAVSAMLIVDHGKKINPLELRSRNVASHEVIKTDLLKAGLVHTESSPKTLAELRECLLQKGSAIVSLSGAVGCHVVVVDHVSRDLKKVRLRDPYHGWEIMVTAEAFLHEWYLEEIIQIES